MGNLSRRFFAAILALIVIVGVSAFALPKTAAAANGEFSLQVSPSPLVITVKPGQTSVNELKIRNAGSQAEKLTIAPRSFTIDNSSGQVKFDDTKTPPEIGDWVTFGSKDFTVQPGETFTQKVSIAVPQGAGFSYSFGLVITRQNAPPNVNGGQSIKASVAIFALISIDKPGATRTLALEDLSTDKQVYEYLPTTINVRFKNTGNTIVQPTGNIFIQRGENDTKPIDTLAVNPSEGYILPGSVRTLSTSWDDGFQVLHTNTDDSGKSSQSLAWNWNNIANIRIGYYTVKLVAIYNDGQRDIPVVSEVGFWVIPWKLLLGALLVVGLVGFGIWSLLSKIFGVSKKRGKRMKFRR